MAAGAASFPSLRSARALMKVPVRPDVDALIRAGVLLFPAALVDQESPQLLMRLHPEHRIDPVFLDHTVPGGLIDLHVHQREVDAQYLIGIGSRGAAVD